MGEGYFFMYKDEHLEQMERYERKLQLVQAIRAENQANQQRIQHRSSIFYNHSEPIPNEPYQNTKDELPNNIAFQAPSFFGLRIGISLLGVVFFVALKYGKIQDFAGVNAKEIKAYVEQDFSKVVVDYMKDFTYTLNYEKPSIK